MLIQGVVLVEAFCFLCIWACHLLTLITVDARRLGSLRRHNRDVGVRATQTLRIYDMNDAQVNIFRLCIFCGWYSTHQQKVSTIITLK